MVLLLGKSIIFTWVSLAGQSLINRDNAHSPSEKHPSSEDKSGGIWPETIAMAKVKKAKKVKQMKLVKKGK